MFIVRKLVVQVNNSFIFCAKSRVDPLPKSLSSADKPHRAHWRLFDGLNFEYANVRKQTEKADGVEMGGGLKESLNLTRGQGRVTSRSRPCRTSLRSDATLYGAQQKQHIDPEVSHSRSSFRGISKQRFHDVFRWLTSILQKLNI